MRGIDFRRSFVLMFAVSLKEPEFRVRGVFFLVEFRPVGQDQHARCELAGGESDGGRLQAEPGIQAVSRAVARRHGVPSHEQQPAEHERQHKRRDEKDSPERREG